MFVNDAATLSRGSLPASVSSSSKTTRSTKTCFVSPLPTTRNADAQRFAAQVSPRRRPRRALATAGRSATQSCAAVGKAVEKTTVDGAVALKDDQTFAAQYGGRVPDWLLLRLREMGFTHPVPIQQKALSLALPLQPGSLGRDVVIHAQTGSGKTLAYLLPAIAAVVPARASVQALVIVPTQELGMQVYKVLRRLTSRYHSALQSSVSATDVELHLATEHDGDVAALADDGCATEADVASGGQTERMTFPVLPMLNQADLRRQKLQLREAAPRIIVGNPHRIAALVQSGRLRLDLLKVLIVDEFDACLQDTATTAALQAVLSVRHRDGARQTILASATVPQHRHFLRQCVRQRWTQPDIQHVWLEEAAGPRVPPSLTHRYAFVAEPRKKIAALRALLTLFNEHDGAEVDEEEKGEEGKARTRALSLHAIVFVMPSRNVGAIVKALNAALESDFGVKGQRPVVGLRDGMSIGLRREALDRFRKRDAKVLLATDVAARGLDVPDISTVVHFDLPTDADAYLHRAGRAGRLGRRGTSVVMLSPGEEFVVSRISNKLGIEFERVQRGASA